MSVREFSMLGKRSFLLVFAVTSLLVSTMSLSAKPVVWNISLGGITLGQLSFTANGQSLDLRTEVDNTPLGAFNGTFAARSRVQTNGRVKFSSSSRASRKTRDVMIISQAGRVVETRITPADELTNFSVPANVPAGVLNPLQAFAPLVTPSGCPHGYKIYDGRRVARLTLLSSANANGETTCNLRYKVEDGPDHLSPINVKGFRLKLTYTQHETGGLILDKMVLRTGVFALYLNRVGG